MATDIIRPRDSGDSEIPTAPFAKVTPEILATLPTRVQAFIAEAHAVGIDIRDGERLDIHGNPLVSFHGSLAQFAQLPAMAKCRVPKRRGHWWMSCGIIGTLYRVTEHDLVGVIHHINCRDGDVTRPYPRLTAENARKEAEKKEAELRRKNESQAEMMERVTEQYMREGPASFLKSMPKSSMEFRRKLMEDIRRSVWRSVEMNVKCSMLHGYTLSAESGDAIKESLDAVVEALMAAEVNLDQAHHTAITHKLHTYLVESGEGAPLQVALVTKPNAGLLTGEQQ